MILQQVGTCCIYTNTKNSTSQESKLAPRKRSTISGFCTQDFFNRLEPAASYQHIEFFYIVRKHSTISALCRLDFFNRLEPAASYQHIEFFYIVRKQVSINQESAIQKISSARSKILRVTRMSKKLGDLIQSNKAVMRRCIAAFFCFCFWEWKTNPRKTAKTWAQIVLGMNLLFPKRWLEGSLKWVLPRLVRLVVLGRLRYPIH